MQAETSKAQQSATGSPGALKYYKRDFWREETLKYTQPHFRLEKAARIINRIAQGMHTDLLDVGCGPAALRAQLDDNINYYGIDIVIQAPAPNLLEADLLESPIRFGERRFGIIVAQGFFEYAGEFQSQKFGEISDLMTDDGTFLVSYVNFDHRDKGIYWPYNNVQPARQFRASLESYFDIKRSFPTSHNWANSEPNRAFMRVSQMPMRVSVPLVSRLLAVEYFFVCAKKK